MLKSGGGQMPAAVIERLPPRSEEMWQALKFHIQRERQRKKQEQEADAENERQRKERELQQKQDVMTLGETREQILVLEQRLSKLKDEKHELFMQLKKVLNEDDNRRRQLVKESNEVLEMYGVTFGGHQLFLQQNMPVANRNPMYKVPPPHNLLPASGGSLKRSCSPSPPPSTGYNHPSYGYKPNQAPPSSSYQKAPPEDNRRGHEYVRAVLWNKNNQYGPFYPTSTTLSYSASAAPAPTAPVQTIYTYAGQFAHAQPPSSSSAGPPPPPPPPPQPSQSQVRGEPPPPPQESQPPPPSVKHPTVYMTQSRAPINQAYMHGPMDHNKSGYPEEKYYSVAPIRPATHVSLHGGSIPIQQPPQGAKTGGITSGYPIRPPSSVPPHAISSAPNQVQHSVYVSQAPSGSRLVYSSAGIPQPSNAPPGRYAISNMQREV
uniref:G protein pathway suppressor 2 n=1 Tax=Laodelphax striatellus TaxID=195883 RepID=A0A499PRP3_LAOST|nr:G protein pathway suppressor 2 [Laodelphax striatellus]